MMDNKKAMFSYLLYGSRTKARELAAFIRHVMKVNQQEEERGRPKTPVCIWGLHGIGKTAIVETIAREDGMEWAYLAPAQLEEMGDLIGMPVIENGRTVFRPPSWVPSKEGPGILLIDDVNRADDRILRGIMQLLQQFELLSWKLPPRWQIILTANPDGGDYSVTPMDEALLTRMLHVTLGFDPREWALWAEQQGVDSRGIQFVLTYPEVVTGRRTTPRSLVQFFQMISSIDDLSAHPGLVRVLADSCLDEITVNAFMEFVRLHGDGLPGPKAVFQARQFDEEIFRPLSRLIQQDVFRVDLLAALCIRIGHYVHLHGKHFDPVALQNLKAFLQMDLLTADLRLALAQELASCPHPAVRAVFSEPEIGLLLLDG